MTWEILFWICALAILHSYVLYPLIITLRSRKYQDNQVYYTEAENLPFISVIMSVYNEEGIIQEKVRSVFHTTYPEEKFELLVGSDGSTDRTNEKLHAYANELETLRFFSFAERRGKPAVVNHLREEAMGEILVLTDAKVIFEEETLFELVRHFKNREVGLVGANILNERIDKTGISMQEWTFMSREIRLKYYEGKIWGSMIGAYGACYAIRNEYFNPIPHGYSVDDFYITMKVLEMGHDCILAMSAVCRENVPNRIRDEFRRKIRISAGNFQNLRTFYKMLWPPWVGPAFAFLSHKVLRWLGPFLLMLLMAANMILATKSEWYEILLWVQGILLLSPFLDYILRKSGIHIVFLRFITHFYSMNLALLAGFFKFVKGTETNVWQPTKRTSG